MVFTRDLKTIDGWTSSSRDASPTDRSVGGRDDEILVALVNMGSR